MRGRQYQQVVFASINGQQASKNLDSPEKFSLGGPSGVRASPLAEAGGDEGYKVTLELRHSFTPALQGTLFYDWGEVTINKQAFGVLSKPNQRSLSGAGVGVNTSLAILQIRASLARRTSGGQPTSIPSSAVKSSTLWVQGAKYF
jgi:hemolysin activation/secretion protein